MRNTSGSTAGVLLVFALLLPTVAHAYLDPGTGSYVVQMLIGTLLGGLVALGVFWRRAVASIKRLFERRNGDDGIRR
jgi:hypothetical protein